MHSQKKKKSPFITCECIHYLHSQVMVIWRKSKKYRDSDLGSGQGLLKRRWSGKTSLKRWHSRWCGSLVMGHPNSWIFLPPRGGFYVPAPCPLNQALWLLTKREKQKWRHANSRAEVLRNWQLPLPVSGGNACSWKKWMFYLGDVDLHCDLLPLHFQKWRSPLLIYIAPS